jgi:hypothetical protein
MGGMDLEAPSAETDRRLHTLISAGRPITTALYPNSEHGMTEFETTPDGERVSTRYPEGYFRMLADYARTGAFLGATAQPRSRARKDGGARREASAALEGGGSSARRRWAVAPLRPAAASWRPRAF